MEPPDCLQGFTRHKQGLNVAAELNECWGLGTWVERLSAELDPGLRALLVTARAVLLL